MGVVPRVQGPKGAVCYPLPPTDFHDWAETMEIYVRFMRQVRAAVYSRPELKILSAVQVTAATMNRDDTEIITVLVDLGLRAPRMAFPAGFLECLEYRHARPVQGDTGLSVAMADLVRHWQKWEGATIPISSEEESLPIVLDPLIHCGVGDTELCWV